MRRTLKSLRALPALLLLAGCSYRGAAVIPDSGTARFPELELKERLQKGSASKSVPLTSRRAISQGQGAEFVVPSGLAYSDSGDLYLSDNNAHTIHLWRNHSTADGELSAAVESARLRFPEPIQVWRGKLFVSDNDGIKVFSQDGHFERLLRTYFAVMSFAVTDRGTVVASLLIRQPEAQDPLVVEIDQTGKVLRRIGNRHASVGADDRENQSFITVSGSRLVVAYKYRPVVEIYDLDSGELVRSFEIHHPVFKALKAQSAPVTDSAGRKLEPHYVAGVKALDDKIFLCLHLPAPEVWEVDGEGKLLAAYRANGLLNAVDIFGFDARSGADGVTFAIGVINPKWEASVSELSSTSS
jgi:predicted small lipoprotein YifL